MKKNICEFLESCDDFLHRDPVTMEEIKATEKHLNLKFADDYVECLLKYGLVCVDATELLGITDFKSRSVVHNTISNKEAEPYAHIPDDLYVIEDLGIDWVLAWQNQKGEVFLTEPWEEPYKVADSLVEYLEKMINGEL